jgi:hypothetical protein
MSTVHAVDSKVRSPEKYWSTSTRGLASRFVLSSFPSGFKMIQFLRAVFRICIDPDSIGLGRSGSVPETYKSVTYVLMVKFRLFQLCRVYFHCLTRLIGPLHFFLFLISKHCYS